MSAGHVGPNGELIDDTSGARDLSSTVYDNSNSGRQATNGQAAIDEAFEEIDGINTALTGLLHQDTIDMTLTADANSALGYYGTLNIASYIALYGKPIAAFAIDHAAYPAIAAINFISASDIRIEVTAKTDTAKVVVVFSKYITEI